MKALIWIGCFLVFVILQLICKYSGIMLGAIPMALGFWLTWKAAEKLCKKWDDTHFKY